MKTIGFSAPYFTDEDAARDYLEKFRWPNGPVCPHCGAVGGHWRKRGKAESKNPTRKGVWKCSKCREEFSVTVGTVFEGSHIPLHKWLLAFYLMCASKKGKRPSVTQNARCDVQERLVYGASYPPRHGSETGQPSIRYCRSRRNLHRGKGSRQERTRGRKQNACICPGGKKRKSSLPAR